MRIEEVNKVAAAATAIITKETDALARFVAEAVQTESVTGSERALGEMFAAAYQSAGLEVAVKPVPPHVAEGRPALPSVPPLEDRPNIFGSWRAEKPTRLPLVLNGHLDTVPGGDPSGWQSGGPFTGARRNGRIWGRGATDMKGGLAAGLFAIRALRAAGAKLPFDVQLQAVVGEEYDGIGTLGALATEPLPGAVIVLEPTEGHVAPASGGAVIFEIAVEGRVAHTGLSYLGISALEKLWEIYAALRDLARTRDESIRHPLYDAFPAKAPFGVGTFSAGEYISMVPGTATMNGRFGIAPGDDLEEVRQLMVDTVDAVASSDPWLATHQPVVRWPHPGFASWETPADHPIVTAVSTGVREAGGDSRPVGVTYSTDGGHFAARQVPVVLFGPGSISRAHLPDEFIEERELVGATTALMHSILTYAAGERESA